MEYCITVNPIPHSQYRTKFDYEWSIEYQLIRNPLVSVNIRSANLLIFKILYYGMADTVFYIGSFTDTAQPYFTWCKCYICSKDFKITISKAPK